MSPRRSKSSPPGFFGTLWRLALVGALLFGAAAAAGYGTVHYLVRTPETQAPDLLTLPVDRAVREASSQGFAVRVAGHEQSGILSRGEVLSQRPLPDQWIKEGATIHVILAE